MSVGSRMLKGAAVACMTTFGVLGAVGILGLVMYAGGAPLWFVVAACGIITFFVFIYVRARLTNVGFRTAAVGDYRSARLYRHDCPHCTAGAQSLNMINGKNRWGPIPKADRIYFAGTDHFHSPLANVRKCNYCGGLGFRHLPFPPKVPYETTRTEEEATLTDEGVDVDELDLPEDL